MDEDWDSDQPAVLETASIKLFGRWDLDEVNVNDISLTVSRRAARTSVCVASASLLFV